MSFFAKVTIDDHGSWRSKTQRPLLLARFTRRARSSTANLSCSYVLFRTDDMAKDSLTCHIILLAIY
jgi:hypothetical protein